LRQDQEKNNCQAQYIGAASFFRYNVAYSEKMNEPIIGITMFRSTSEYGYPIFTIAEAYIQAIARGGGSPVLIPSGISQESIINILSVMDGILFTGGGDVHPDRYFSKMHPLVSEVDNDRDETELQILQKVLKMKLPFLGICRGIQVINVGFGGTLYEDILDQRPGSLRHSYFPEMPRHYLAHEIQIDSTSQLSRILGKTHAQVNSLHHQGIKDLGQNLRPTAFSPDGLVEAFEYTGNQFGMAVQWHPEWLPDEASMSKLFQAFTDSARK
jgi:putative glutamine amidotransferase